MLKERVASFITTEKKVWNYLWNNHRGYFISLMLHPAFGVIDATTTYVAISAGKTELNYAPKIIIDNLGVETFCFARIALAIGTAYGIDKYIRRSEPKSEKIAAWSSNLTHIGNVHMAINNIPEMFFL